MAEKSIKLTGGRGWGVTRECSGCGRPETDCRCPQAPAESLPAHKQLARLRLEKRRGKPVTVAAGLVMSEAQLKALLKELKARCGAGGTLKDGELEIQGDQRETLRALFEGKGFRVKGG
ncbi:translation initiation factor [Desulfuromonas versatilis]|uniref:Translation initiation factor n=1 Tax=Desulfuromonas versatilis TaxID=2802975 RepID=A0ABM8HU18_9BACT|nr:translation initiation factor [Desulfuromonas versatilis]BCR06432.1 translation initiation factor [Desulfuromonas versatilis]